MSDSPLSQLSPARRADMLRQLAQSKRPRLLLPTLASRAGVLAQEVSDLAAFHGGLDQPRRLLRAADILSRAASPASDSAVAPAASADVDDFDGRVDEARAAFATIGNAEKADAGATALSGLQLINVDLVKPSPNNPRRDLVDIDELALSIRENGLIQPIVVQHVPGQPHVQIVAGHRRHAAVRRLGWPKVPCIVRRDMLPDDELLAMLVENGQRAGLDPIEEARAYKRLEDGGLTHAQIATKVGRSAMTVSTRLMLLTLPPEEQEQIRAGHSTLDRGISLVRDRRKRERQAASPIARPIGRPKGAKTKPYFGETHPLAQAARERCGHTGTPKIAGVACGPCIEAVIREDERERLQADGGAA